MSSKKLYSGALVAFCAANLIVANSQMVSAQHLVAARAGLVNFAGPDVQLIKAGETISVELERYQQAADGDRMKTGEQGRAEILLNPGSYLRLDRSTEVKFIHTDFPEIACELSSGSAIVEAGDLHGTFRIQVRTPHSLIQISRDGLYRIDLRAGSTELAVHKGEAVVGSRGTEKKIGKDKLAKIISGSVELAKIDNVAKDQFDYWSQDRAETLIASNRALVRRNGFSAGWMGNRWVFDSLFGMYTFVPFGSFYYSPYFSRYGYWCPFYGSGYWAGGYSGGGYSGGLGVVNTHEKLGKAIYTLSPKAPGSLVQVVEQASPGLGGDRFSRAPIHTSSSGASGYSMGSMSAPASSGPTPSGHEVAPIGKGKN